MTSSSKPGATPKPANPYTRFIPREELQGFAAWTPNALNQRGQAGAAAAAPAPPPPTESELRAQFKEQLLAARQGGYQDGYRDGLVALDGFKQSFAQQMAAQVGTLMTSFDEQLDALEQQMAQTIARCATQLAQQLVRSELAARPDLVVRVAEEAVNTVLLSARHIRVHLHPDDVPLVAQGAADTLQARGVRLIASAEVQRGGCLVQSDVGTIDARIEARWAQAAALLGEPVPWIAESAGEAI
jgi:flagellar assembly protein FliH